MPTNAPRYPETPRVPVEDEYHGVRVADEYRWLEDFNDPRVREWNEAQNRVTRAWLDARPSRGALRRRLHHLYTATSSDYYALKHRGGLLFAIKFQPPRDQPYLVTLRSADEPETEQVVLDPNTLDPNGTTAIDFYEPSLDGRYVAVSLSEKGSEDGTLYIFEAATGRKLEDVIPRVNYPTAGGSVAWNPDGTGFWYTRYPHAGERPSEDVNFYQQVYFHRLGVSAGGDEYAIGQEFPRIAEIALQASPSGQHILATVANGDGGEFSLHLRTPDGKWKRIADFPDRVTHAEFDGDRALILLSLKGTPRGQLLRLPLDAPDLARAEVIVPEGTASIQGMTPTDEKLYVVELDGGPSQIRVFDLKGRDQGLLPTPPVSSVLQVLSVADDEILFRSASFVEPPAWFRFVPKEEEPRRTALFVQSPAEFGDAEVVRLFAVSKDGTRVPINIIRRKGLALDGNNPTVLLGYGGYGISLSPSFNIRRRAWLDQGGVYVVANLRGGGEYGEEWHLAGNLTNKQNVFDDFIACARHLIESGVTRPGRLAIEGGSNGGLLMGAALTQHPDLFRAVVAHVGIYDMLRVELDPNGAFNVTEFGTVQVPEQFRALYAYSPYHRVVDGTEYPAVLLVTGENDGRVNPANSRKMAARLQAASASGHPVLLRTSASSGHGLGTGLHERIEADADVFAFLMDQLDVASMPVQAPAAEG